MSDPKKITVNDTSGATHLIIIHGKELGFGIRTVNENIFSEAIVDELSGH